GLVQIVPCPGKLKLKVRLGETYEKEAQLKLEKEKILLATEVKKAYYRSLFNQQTVNILEKNLEMLEEIQKNAVSRYALSAVSYTDILRVRLEIARTRNDLLEARKDQAISLSELNLLLGLEKDTPLSLTSSLEDRPENLKLEKLIENRRAQSPTLQMIRIRQTRADILDQVASKDRLPDFSFGLFSPSKKWGAAGFSFGLSYPLFSRKRISGEKELAVAEKQKALLSALAAERFYESRKRQVLNEINQAEQQIKIFEDNLLQDTEAELEKALNDYRLGRLDSLGLLDLYRNSSLVRLEYYRALYLYQVSLAELEKAGEDYE
ncbi:MAG: TolC family protein, partial [Candidatus Saccharicenans sp.]